MIKSLHYYLKIFRPLILVLLWIFVAGTASGQSNSCAFKLQEAENLYETGNFDSIPAMLRTCIEEDNFDDEELSRAYRLLILTYLFEDYQEMADLTMQKFLKKFPEYEVKATDPIEFSYLLKSYKTIPTFSIGVIGGTNYSFVRIIEPYSLSQTENYSGEYSVSGFNFQVGLSLKKYINEEIEVNLDILYAQNSFEYIINQLDSKIRYNERQSIISFPLTGSYDFNIGKISPFVRAGFNLDYKFDVIADFNKEYTGDFIDENIKETDINILEDRKPLNVSAIIGGGMKYDIKKGYIMLDIKYHFGLMNNVNTDNRYSDFKWSNYNYIDDDFALNHLFISVGYVYSFYKTIKVAR